MVKLLGLSFLIVLLLFSGLYKFICRTFASMLHIDNSMIATFVLLMLPVVLSCSKPEVPVEIRGNTSASTEVIESIRRDLGMLDSETLELLDYEAILPGGWNLTEIATVLKSKDDKFQIAEFTRNPENSLTNRWSISYVSVRLIDGTGDVIVFEREFDHRPTSEDVEAFKKWRKEW